jgi:hypothetical protein
MFQALGEKYAGETVESLSLLWCLDDAGAPSLVLFIGTTVGTRHQLTVNTQTGTMGDAVVKYVL